MTDRDFMAAIIANPADDAPRLVYADWLEEHDDPRGEFIRVQIELARSKCEPPCPGNVHAAGGFGTRCVCRRARLRAREQELKARHGFRLAGSAGRGAFWNRTDYTFSRGFVARVKCSVANWKMSGGRIARSTPLEWVEMRGCRPLARKVRSYESGDESYRWSRPRYGEECMNSWNLPSWLMDRMPNTNDYHGFRTEAAAMAALSVAAIEWAKEQPE